MLLALNIFIKDSILETGMNVATTTHREITKDTSIDQIYKKITLRLIPFLLLCYVLSYLDRVNVGFAKLQMLSDLNFSEAVYGLGAGIFFLGYFLFEVPSNIIMHKVGARRWIARIMITWGFLSAMMMLVQSEIAFYSLRFLLGVAEAGFFPGIIYYLTKWYPAERRGRATALFLTAIAIAGVVGGPISGWIMRDMAGVGGLAGWKWLFLIEGMPSILVGLLVLRYLDDSVEDAKWLNTEEKETILSVMARDVSSQMHLGASKAFFHGRTWLLAVTYFLLVFSLYGISFWLPTIIKNAGVTDPFQNGLLSAVPWAAGCAAMVIVARSSDRTRERRWHVALPAIIGAAGFVFSVQYGSDIKFSIVALSVATMGCMSALPVFWSLPTAYLRGAAAAAGIALINSVGNLSGFFGPSLIGAIKAATGSLNNAVYLLAGSLILGAILTLINPSQPINHDSL
jgi:D-galactonate transporter